LPPPLNIAVQKTMTRDAKVKPVIRKKPSSEWGRPKENEKGGSKA